MTCANCNGCGFVKVQICCGNWVVGATYMGEQEYICCDDPEEDVECCRVCEGSGEVRSASA